MQSAKVIVVLVALSQVECAPPSIWPTHRLSPPEIWPFKQQPAAGAPLTFFTHFPGSTPAPSDVAVPAETVITESIINAGNPIPVEVLPKESSLPAEIIVQEVVEVESAPQDQVPVVFTNENVTQEVVAENVTDVPVETTTVTTAAPVRYQDTETYRAYEQFLSTWLQQASLTLNRPELLNMVTQRRQNIITPEVESPAKQSVSQSVEKSIEKVVEQVTVSESIEPQVTPIEVVSPETIEISKKTSGPLKKTPATLVTKSATDVPLLTDIDVAVESILTSVPVPSSENAVPFEPLEVTFITSDPALESQNLDIVTIPELIASELVPENPPVQENITEVEFVAEALSLQPEPVPSPVVAVHSEPLEITTKASDTALESRNLEIVATPEQIAFESLRKNSPVQEQTISEVDLVAEPSFLQPVVVPQPSFLQPVVVPQPAVVPQPVVVPQPAAVGEFVLAAESQLPESSYSKLSVSPAGTILIAPPAISPSAQPALPKPTLEPAVLETFSPQGLTYTLKYFPKQGSSFFYSHALGG